MRVAVEQRQTMRPLPQRDGGARLLIGGRLWQIVVHSEPHIVGAGPNATRNILIALRGVAPDAVQNVEQTLVAGLSRYFRDTRHQVCRADGVALDVLALVDRHAVLPV